MEEMRKNGVEEKLREEKDVEPIGGDSMEEGKEEEDVVGIDICLNFEEEVSVEDVEKACEELEIKLVRVKEFKVQVNDNIAHNWDMQIKGYPNKMRFTHWYEPELWKDGTIGGVSTEISHGHEVKHLKLLLQTWKALQSKLGGVLEDEELVEAIEEGW